MTTSRTAWPVARCASAARLLSTWLATAGAEYSWSCTVNRQLPSPMCRFTRLATSSGRIRACRLAFAPTTTSVAESNSTTLGVVSCESAFVMTAGRPYSSTYAMHEYVVPRSMPKTLLVTATLLLRGIRPTTGRVECDGSAGPPVHFHVGDTHDRAVGAGETCLHGVCNRPVGGGVRGRQATDRVVPGGVEPVADRRGEWGDAAGVVEDLQQLGAQQSRDAVRVDERAEADHQVVELEHAGDDRG